MDENSNQNYAESWVSIENVIKYLKNHLKITQGISQPLTR